MSDLVIKLKSSGHRDLADRIKRFGSLGRASFAAAAFRWATNVISTAMRVTPYDTGWLRRSRYLEVPTVNSSGSFTVNMGFSAPYALWVHEINKRYTVGEWKFLEKAMKYHGTSAMREIAAWTDVFIKAGGTPTFESPHPSSPLQWVQPRHPLSRKVGESAKKHHRRIVKAKALKVKGRIINEKRMADEMMAAIAGRNPRPGRGGK